MEPLKVADILFATGGELLTGDPDTVITGVSTDTRTIKSGDLYIALRGEKFDGHEFAATALADGAAGVVISHGASLPPLTIRVADTLKALGDLAEFYTGQLSIRKIGVTGSVGKTTTKEMIAAILSRRFRTLKSEMNFNNEIGVPLTLFQLTREHKAVVVEMAMRLPGEIAQLAGIVHPNVGVITNIGMSHIERLGSLQAIAAVKAELLDALPEDGLAVLPADDTFFDFLLDSCNSRAVSFGVYRNADVQGQKAAIDPAGCPSFDLLLPDRPAFRVELSVVGEHNIHNALAAAAVGWHYQIPADDIRAALEEFTPPRQRACVVRSPRGYVVFDDSYNASPASVSSALATLGKMAGERRIAVLGDMLELGDYAREAHRELGRQAAKAGVDLLVTVGELAKWIAEGSRERGLTSIESVDTSEQAAKLLAPRVRPGDVILVKGSRAMKMERVVDSLVP